MARIAKSSKDRESLTGFSPQPSSRRTSSPTVEQLRAAIDSGRTGDKIPVADPAAAPLGADEEAAGTPLSAERVAAAHASEVRRPSASRTGSRHGAALLVGFLSAVLLLTALALAVGG